MADLSRYPRPSLTADVVVFTVAALRPPATPELRVLLVRRGGEPHRGRWALPGGFVGRGETVQAAAARELAEETGVAGLEARLVGLHSQPDRDPRGWVVSAAYCALLPAGVQTPAAGSDAAEARWWPARQAAAQELAFDHARILRGALAWLQGRALDGVAIRALLPASFTVAQLCAVVRALRPSYAVPPRRVREVLIARGLIAPLGRGARLCRFTGRVPEAAVLPLR